MKKILFITNRNILTSCGELRLIKNRTEMLYKCGDVQTDFIVMNSIDRFTSKQREKIENIGKIVECAYKSKYFFMKSVKKAQSAMIKKIDEEKYSTVILSGALTYKFAEIIKNKYPNINVILDIHGASEDMLEIAKHSNGVKKYALKFLYKYESKSLSNATKYCDGLLVVTDELKNYLISKYPVIKDKKFYRIPCAYSQNLFTQDEYDANRNQYREKYGIKDELVFVYSGGTSTWQCIEESIDLYKQIDESLNRKTKMLIFSYNAEQLKSLINNDSRFSIDSYEPNELGKALCASDFAFLLRKKSLTNKVAFPNKFLEYVAGGMKIITTPYVTEIAKQVEKFNCGYIYDFKFDQSIINYIENVEPSYNQGLIKEVLDFNSYERCLKELIELINSN